MSKHDSQVSVCESFADLLVDYSDSELAADRRQLVEDHIASCAACRRQLARLNASRELLRTAIRVPQATGGHAAYCISPRNRFSPRKCISPTTRISRQTAVTLLAAAAATLLAVIGTAWFGATEQINSRKTARLSTAHARASDAADAAPKISPDEALWHITLVEQQARLQASLDLLPRHGPFAAQREQDRRLLAEFQSLTQTNEIH